MRKIDARWLPNKSKKRPIAAAEICDEQKVAHTPGL